MMKVLGESCVEFFIHSASIRAGHLTYLVLVLGQRRFGFRCLPLLSQIIIVSILFVMDSSLGFSMFSFDGSFVGRFLGLGID